MYKSNKHRRLRDRTALGKKQVLTLLQFELISSPAMYLVRIALL